MTHVSAHVVDSAAKSRNRVQGDAGTVSTFVLAVTVGRRKQAVTPAKHAAQAAIVSLLFSSGANGGSPLPDRKRCHIATPKIIRTQKGRETRPFSRPRWFRQNSTDSFEMNGGDDETRTRDLCRDRAAF